MNVISTALRCFFVFVLVRQFIVHCLKQLRKKRFAVNFIHQQHFFCALIRKITDGRRHKFQGGSCFLYKHKFTRHKSSSLCLAPVPDALTAVPARISENMLREFSSLSWHLRSTSVGAEQAPLALSTAKIPSKLKLWLIARRKNRSESSPRLQKTLTCACGLHAFCSPRLYAFSSLRSAGHCTVQS